MNEKDTDDLQSTPPELRAAADDACKTLVPERSRERYESAHKAFLTWCNKKNVAEGHYTESVLLAYFSELSGRYASSTLWTIFSMLKKTILANHGRNIGAVAKVVAFIKKKSTSHAAKKSAAFSRGHIERYLREANDDLYLPVKVAMLLGLFGACRKSELAAMEVGDINDHGDHLMVKIQHSKTGPRMFAVIGSQHEILNALVYLRKYILLRPKGAPPRLFLNYKGGKYTRQPIGINMIAQYPKMIAEFLNLPDTKNIHEPCDKENFGDLDVR